MNSLVTFALFAALLTITPGLDTLLVLRVAGSGGRGAGIAATAGIHIGCLVWGAASAVGVTALLTASRVAFDALRLAGAAYLCWLGVRALWTVMRRPREDDRTGAPALSDQQHWSRGRALRTGLTTNLLNPKVGAFYLSVVPQFLPSGVNPLAGSMALTAIHALEGMLWLSAVALVVNRARAVLTRPSVRRWFEQITGVVLVGFGIRLALDNTA